MIESIAIVGTCAIAAWEWALFAEKRAPRNLGFAVFTTLLAIAVMVN